MTGPKKIQIALIAVFVALVALTVVDYASAQSYRITDYGSQEAAAKQDTKTTAIGEKGNFRRELRKAIRRARSKGEISGREAMRLQTATFSPAFLKQAEDLCLIQMMMSGEKTDDVLPVGADGLVDRSKIDWEAIGDFLQKILPILLEFLLGLGIGF